MTAFRILARTQEFSSTLYFVIVSAIPKASGYRAEDVLLKTGNAFSQQGAREMRVRFVRELTDEIVARGDRVIADP
jgi:hypothetical protein